jgi:hypothetical protein
LNTNIVPIGNWRAGTGNFPARNHRQAVNEPNPRVSWLKSPAVVNPLQNRTFGSTPLFTIVRADGLSLSLNPHFLLPPRHSYFNHPPRFSKNRNRGISPLPPLFP